MEVPEDIGVAVPAEISMAASARIFCKRSIVGVCIRISDVLVGRSVALRKHAL